MPDNTQIIPCGGWYIDTTMLQFQNKVLKVVGDIDGAYLPLSGGTMSADAIIEGTDELQISVADTGESGTVGVTPESVTLVHNTNSTPDASVRLTANSVVTEAEDTVVAVNGSGVNFNGANLTGVGSIIGQNSGEVTIETVLDMNNHKITSVDAPTDPTDAVTKAYVDNKQAAYIAPLSAAPTQQDFNNLLTALQNAGLMATQA